MKDWRTLSKDERTAARGNRSNADNREIMQACLASVLELLANDPAAIRIAWKIAWGCYLINTAEEIAAHCKASTVLIPPRLDNPR